MSQVLFISGHPDLKISTANQKIISQLDIENIKIHKLDMLYPDYVIDIAAEQAALVAADLVVIQFPLYWSTFPALLKKWFDDLWTYNFAFGPEGDKLKNKKVIVSITAGATEDSYSSSGFNFMTLENYLEAALHPLKAAQMDIRDIITTFNMNADVNEGGDADNVGKLVKEHLARLTASISANR